MSDKKLIEDSSILLTHPVRIKLLELLQKEGTKYISEISKELDMNRKSLVVHLSILERTGLISSNYESKSLQVLKSRNPSVENYIAVKNYTLTERAREILEKLHS